MPGRYVVVPRDGREEIVVPDDGGYLVSGRRDMGAYRRYSTV